jgi:hypothetical protein
MPLERVACRCGVRSGVDLDGVAQRLLYLARQTASGDSDGHLAGLRVSLESDVARDEGGHDDQ